MTTTVGKLQLATRKILTSFALAAIWFNLASWTKSCLGHEHSTCLWLVSHVLPLACLPPRRCQITSETLRELGSTYCCPHINCLRGGGMGGCCHHLEWGVSVSKLLTRTPSFASELTAWRWLWLWLCLLTTLVNRLGAPWSQGGKETSLK